MRAAFSEATVVGFEGLAPSLQCHPKDRHVLAAAVVGAVDVLVTNNLKDFPAKACEGYDLQTLDADPFLLSLLARDAVGTSRAILNEASRRRAPAVTVRQLLASLTKVAPTYAHTVWNGWDELKELTSDVRPMSSPTRTKVRSVSTAVTRT